MVRVRVQPRASRDEIVGERNGALVVRLTAPPVDNRANEALIRLVAKRLGVAPRRITLLQGARSRDKVLEVDGLESTDVMRQLDERK